ncbi:MAG: hypothetical protein V2I33_05430 [Kangiellaceae bacterium]|jgi:hypothetical protein|nr:hypothetical protein [Kangiellaceae bacterium]
MIEMSNIQLRVNGIGSGTDISVIENKRSVGCPAPIGAKLMALLYDLL